MKIKSRLLYLVLFYNICFCEVYSQKVFIEGVNNKEILDVIMTCVVSSSKLHEKESVFSRFRIKKDIETIKDILYSFGYFDADVSHSIKNKKIHFIIDLKTRYKFYDVLIKYKDFPEYRSGLKIGEVFKLINIEQGSYTSTGEISRANSKLKRFFEKRGFAFVNISNPKLKLDRKNKRFRVVYSITLNKKIILDKTIIKIEGAKHKKQTIVSQFVENRICWRDGDVFDIEKLEDTKEDIMKSGIFSSIDINLSDPKDDQNDKNVAHANVYINIKEALLRDISIGGKYGSIEKFGANITWTHYNIDGKGGRLSLILDGSKNIKKYSILYNKYDLFGPRQELKNKIYSGYENTKAYKVRRYGIESILWIPIVRKIQFGFGFFFEDSTNFPINLSINERDIKKSRQKFDGYGIPFGINIDTTKNYLDPQSGIRTTIMSTNYLNKNKFSIVEGKCSCYIPMSSNEYNNRMVMSGFIKMGSILNADSLYIPRDKLFFGGGSNSVRGYGFQKLGSYDDNRKPIGGRSIFEIGIEPRYKINDDMGIVAFIEGGRVFSNQVPNVFSNKLLWGWGVGCRYYTPLGPIRFDLAFPTKIRKTSSGKKVDSKFNIYISIGQAF